MLLNRYCIVLFFLFLVHYTFPFDIISFCNKQFQRPITVLEIGVENPIIFALARQKKNKSNVHVLLSWEKAQEHAQLCKRENFSNVVVLGKSVVLEDFKLLDDCEHFDLVIIRKSVLEKFPDNLFEAFKSCVLMGEIVCFEDPVVGLNSSYAHNYGKWHDNWLVINHPKKFLRRTAWFKPVMPIGEFRVESSETDKKLYKRNSWFGTSWVPGINLYTYVANKGIYPTKEYVYALLQTFRKTRHNDIWIGNFVLKGASLQLIDTFDLRRSADPKKYFKICLEKFKNLTDMK